MTKWEYKRYALVLKDSNRVTTLVQIEDREGWLNGLGEEGWELVTYHPLATCTVVLLKRPLATLADSDYISDTRRS